MKDGRSITDLSEDEVRERMEEGWNELEEELRSRGVEF